jgi:hypothetical protein
LTEELAGDRIVIRTYPKIVYLYPTVVAAIIAAIWTGASMGTSGDVDSVGLGPGRVFIAIYIFNMLVLAFDFSRKGFTAVVLTVALMLTFGLLIAPKVPVFRWLEQFLEIFVLRAHPHFYLAIAFTLLIMIGSVVVTSRYTFWEIRHNEIIHYQGFMADVERFPAPGLRFKKQIPDVFEYVLLRAGTIILMPAQGEKQEIQNVPNVNVIERKLDGLLGTIQVQMVPSDAPAPPPLPPQGVS